METEYSDELFYSMWWCEFRKKRGYLKIFEMHYIQGWSIKELADFFRVSPSMIKMKLKRARIFIARHYLDLRVVVRRSTDEESL